MGVVYRARDERLERDVALKVLSVEAFADEEARKRFRKEALVLAKLNHPNIGFVYDFDRQDGVDFLVMEYIPGTTLAEYLKGRSLAEKEVIALGAQIAAALEEANGQDVVHRDLKPGNVMVTPKGQAKVLDFGLAKLLRTGAEAGVTLSRTETQGISGTLPYMAPEQLRGEPADARTDIHALGAMLYEMATGKRPYREESSPQLTDAILHQSPVAPRALNAQISPELERIVLKCLEKDAENRYQAAKEVGVDLRRIGLASSAASTMTAQRPQRRRWPVWSGVALGAVLLLVGAVAVFGPVGWRDRLMSRGSAPHIESIAVLPLENLSGDPEQEYFVDGMTEALITDLAQISALKVISRTSVMQYKGVKKSLPEIARELKVDAVIEGSVQRSRDRVRITTQLIHAATDTHLWARSYERDMRDVLTLQSEVARTIASEIKIKLTPGEEIRMATARPVNPAAHEAFLKGRYHWNKFSQEGLTKSIEYFQEAIRQDPNYALAYTGLANAYTFQGAISEQAAPREAMPQAERAAKKALELDESLADAHVALALVRLNYDWNWAAAEKEFKRALELNPSHADANHWYSHYLLAVGEVEASLAVSKRALEVDPLSLAISIHLGCHYLYARQYDEGVEASKKTVELDPNFWWARYFLGVIYEQKGQFADAITQLQKAREIEPAPRTLAALGHVYAVSSKRAEAIETLQALKEQSKRRYVSPFDMALIHAGLGEKDQAFQLLEKAYEDRSGWLVYLKVEPRLDSLRSDPRFQAMLRRLKFPQ